MAKRRNLEKARYIMAYGLSPNKNWTWDEVKQWHKKQKEKGMHVLELEQQKYPLSTPNDIIFDRHETFTRAISGTDPRPLSEQPPPKPEPAPPREDPKHVEELLEALEDLTAKPETALALTPEEERLYDGLTERQKKILNMRLRGFTTAVISRLLTLPNTTVNRELMEIKMWQIERGRDIDQHEVVGSARNFYDDVVEKANELYYTSETVADKTRALSLAMAAKEKGIKLLTDLGLLKKQQQDITVKHEHTISPMFRDIGLATKKMAAGNIITAALPPVIPPTPDLEEDIQDGEVVMVDVDKDDDEVIVEDDSVDLESGN
jgi:hypothetical protein